MSPSGLLGGNYAGEKAGGFHRSTPFRPGRDRGFGPFAGMSVEGHVNDEHRNGPIRSFAVFIGRSSLGAGLA